MKYTLKEKLRFVKLHIEENVPIYEIERNRKNLTLKKCKAKKYIDKRVKQV